MALQDTKILKVAPGGMLKYFHQLESFSDTYSPNKSIPSITTRKDTVPTDLTVYLKHIKLSKACRKYVVQNLEGDQFLNLGWTLFDIGQFIKTPEPLGSRNLKLDFTAQHHFEVNEDFVANLDENPIVFELQATNDSKTVTLGKALFHIEHFLDVINKKEHGRVLFENDDIDPGSACVAYLDIWYKFTCNTKRMKKLHSSMQRPAPLKKNFDALVDLPTGEPSVKTKIYDTMKVTDSELDQFADNVLLVLNRNKVLKTTQAEINHTLQERVRWLRYEANWKQTLQENAILHGKNPENIIWRQWREEDTARVRLRTYDRLKPVTYDPNLLVTVVKLKFLQGSTPMRDPSIQRVYVEYSFLGQEGPEMETPFSVMKNNTTGNFEFNFTKTFGIDIEKNYHNCKLLTEMIKKDDVIKFTVISEPLDSLEKPIQTCEEIGTAEVPFEDIIQLEDNIDVYQYEIVDVRNVLEVIGYITLKFEGILAMRKMALTLMAPKGYRLFM